MAVTLTFFKFERLIQIDSPQVTTSIQDLLNEIRLYEEKLINLDYGHIANAYGKQSLGGGAYIGITLELINNWRIQFEARSGPTYVLCTVNGGNLVAINAYSNTSINPTAFTQVVIAQSSSPTIIQPASDLNMLYLLESLQGKNKTLGNIWYWDPTIGNDSNNGTQPSKAVATFAQAQSLATAGNNDVVFCLATHSSGITTITENLTISKNGLKVRGPGFPFQIKPTGSSTVPVTITADNVELSGFYIQPASGGSVNGVTVTGDNALIKDCWINSATNNGIDLSSTARSTVQTCAIENSASNGINISNSTSRCIISTSIVSGSGADGVNINGTAVTDNILENNLIYNNVGYGVDVGAGVLRTGVRLHHTFSGNTAGATRDLGTGTFIETQAGGTSASEIADAVWDEVLASHLTSGTTGKALKDTKTKATLASLK